MAHTAWILRHEALQTRRASRTRPVSLSISTSYRCRLLPLTRTQQNGRGAVQLTRLPTLSIRMIHKRSEAPSSLPAFTLPHVRRSRPTIHSLRLQPWPRAPPRSSCSTCRAHWSAACGSRTCYKVRDWGVTVSEARVYRASYQKPPPKTNPIPAGR